MTVSRAGIPLRPMRSASDTKARDLRIDLFRGLALLFIFVDHVPNNTWANYTLKNFGFCDASEVFVFLSGYAAMLAYGRATLSFNDIATRAYRRAFMVYLWHLAVLVTCVALLYAAGAAFGNGSYVGSIGIGWFADEPLSAMAHAAVLLYQPNQMNILPMYVVLLLWFPFICALLRWKVAIALVLSSALWAGANTFGLNLPTSQAGEGWYFNPLAWQLLFVTGAAASLVVLPQSPRFRGWVLLVACAYLAFGFIYAAPWNLYSWAPDGRLLSYGTVGEVSKTYLSLWRYLNILALAYVVSEAVPASAAFLRHRWAALVIACGQTSLQIFALGTVLSFVGWIVSTQVAASIATEAAINVVGLAILGFVAYWLTGGRTQDRNAATATPLLALSSRGQRP